MYLAQVSVTYSETSAYLPYAAGCIAAYAKSLDEINESFNFGEILHMRKKIDESMEEIKDPFLVGFSSYIWNMEYNKALARAVKEKYPDCYIVFGGHNIPYNASLLEEEPYIDFLIHGEGEFVFVNLLKALLKNDFTDMTDISLRRDGKSIMLPRSRELHSLEDLPSPYLSGVFDSIFRDYPDTPFQCALETNRGCPYSCAFCDWCFTEKIRLFPLEKVLAEIDWISDHKVPYCYCADANFGINERDMEIARYIVERNKSTGYPQIFKPNYAKNSDDRVFAIGSYLNSNKVDKGITLAYQSMSPDVLENIGRRNLDIEYFSRLNARYTEAGIPTYTELILGLPGETYDSFCHGLCNLLEAGQHNSMTVYTCQVYCNSPLAQPEYKAKYGIKWERMPMHESHYPANFNGIQEYYDIITETKDMSKSDWIKANLFSVYTQGCHHLGLLRCIAVYSRFELGISYYEFYNRVLDYSLEKKGSFIYSLLMKIKSKIEDTEHTDWCYRNKLFSNVGWYFEEGIFLECVYHFEEFKNDIKNFISSLGIDKDVLTELIDYQNSIIRLPGQRHIEIDSKYDFYNYFERIFDGKYKPLEKKRTKLLIDVEKEIDTWDVYAKEIIWYGKRRSATLLTNPRETIRIIQ